MKAPTVFISYSHKDEKWKDRLVTHLGVLEKQNLLDLWVDTRIETGDDWYPEIQKAMTEASVAILMVTANFLTSKFILREEVPRLLERRAIEGLRVFPIIISPCAWKNVKWLSRMQVRPKDAKPLSGGNDHQVDTHLAAIAEEIAAIIQRAAPLATPKGFVPLGPDNISLARLPSTSSDLFGRENELKLLDDAWQDPNTNIVSFVAWGGVGKTALVNVWLNRMSKDNFRGAERVFGWSFYSQGAREGAQVSADPFIAAALKWFGDPDPAEGSVWEKAERLASLIRQRPTLLILDGMEPLQSPFEQGRIKDQGLCCLVKELAAANNGLCVISTRLKVFDLEQYVGSSVSRVMLEQLPIGAGQELLRQLGVQGTDGELKQAVGEFGGHALALTLLGKYLSKVHKGDVRKRGEIPRLTDEVEKGGHARRVMESYEKWLKDKRELEILRIMGLFDRPVEAGAIQAVKAQPAIKVLTSKLQKLSKDKWQFAVSNLREFGLLDPEDENQEGTLDCHPLIREHFGDKLQSENPAAWKEAHNRLYEYYKSVAKEHPDTIEEMAPLYAAVAHGCRAGRYQEAWTEVYMGRIQRGNKYFHTHKLGASGAELAILSGFFDPPWTEPISELNELSRAHILNLAGHNLRALGRLEEAAQPMKAALDATVRSEDWANAARQAVNLSELSLAMGSLQQAVKYAQECVKHADRGGDEFGRWSGRASLANALYQSGRISEAEGLFQKAEKILKKSEPEFPLLTSVPGFQYCDLLLSQGEHQAVQRRAKYALEVARVNGWLLDIALDQLSLRRAHLLQDLDEGAGDFTQATEHITEVVNGLRKSGQQDYLPLGLLARAELYRVTKEYDKAQKVLDEIIALVTRSGMRLHEADCHLEQARLHLALDNKTDARLSYATAKQMINEMGYHRRDKEIADLKQQLG